MKRPTYEDVQELKATIAGAISNFRFQFGEVPIKSQNAVKLKTQHGIETIRFTLEDVPAYDQGVLPGMNAENDEPMPIRRSGPARTFPIDG